MTKRGYIFLIIIIGLVVFANALFNGFVWDDEEQILNNVLVHSFSNFFSFFSGSTFNTGGSGTLGGLYYKPLMTAAFSLIYTFFGTSAFFFHLFQILLHITNAIFVFLIFRVIFQVKSSNSISFILAVIFLIHPINVEAVSYISCLQDILFFFFGIIAFWLIVTKRIVSIRSHVLLFGLMLSSLLSKETGILFILVDTLYVFLFSRKQLKNILITAFLSVSAYSFLRFVIAGIFFNKHGLTPISTLPFFERLLSVPKISIFYFKTFFYPNDLAISQHWVVRSLSLSDFYLPLSLSIIILGLFGIMLYIFYSKKSDFFKTYIFFLIWFLAGMIMHIQIVFPLDMTVSERWFYFPMTGLLGLISVIFLQIKLNKLTKKVLVVLLILLLLLLSFRTIIRNGDWKDGLTLYSHDVLFSTNTFDIENNFGVELFRAGRFEEAGKHFEASTKIAPNWWTNWNNLGAVEERNGNLENAKKYYQKAIDNGRYYLAYQNLAKIYLIKDGPEKSKVFCEESLKSLPNNAELWAILAISEYKLNDHDKAVKAAQNAYTLEQSQQNAYVYSRLMQNLPLEN
ncbi:MAG: tetratricopeptide repeat protein [Microgenomates group bacterium]|jgi:hypothetical protein